MKIRRKPIPKTDLRKQDLLSLINLDEATTIRVHEDDFNLLHNEIIRKDVKKLLRENNLTWCITHIGKSVYLGIHKSRNL